ncbi:MAG: TonB-dependent receptor [Gemmatimonadota bacterium]|nr:TonB-dependent receptor [Gemmatimonadota bacterium]
MSHRRVIPFVAALLLAAPSLGAQQVTGRVLSQTGEPLAAVQVFIAGSGIGALTQQNGRYLLLNVPAGTHTLSAQRIGFQGVTAEITVVAGETLVQDFTLSEEALGLDEIIVTGTAGGARQREVGTAVSRLDARELGQMRAAPSLSQALQGQVAGLMMTQSSPQAGAAPHIALRGRNSVNQGDSPLVYVDGVRMYARRADTRPSGGGIDAQYNPLAHIKAEDIERIEVVRGPAATTLYGTEASGGVIQIFTRRGSADLPTQWSATGSAGFHTLTWPGPDRTGNSRFDGAYTFGNPDGLGWFNCVDRVTSIGQVYGDITCPADGDWVKPALIQRYNLQVSGGSGGFTYAISGRYGDEGVPLDGSGIGQGRSSQFQPLEGRVGYNKDGGVRGAFTIDFAPTLRAEWTSSLSLNTQKWAPSGAGSRSVFNAPMQRGFRGAVQVDGQPAAGLHFSQGEHIDKRRQVLTGFVMSHIPTSYFDHRLSVGYDLNVVNAEHFHKVGHVMRPTGQLNQIDFEARTTTFDYGANLRTSLGEDISSTTSAGFQAYREFTRRTNYRVEDFPGPVAKPTLVAGAVQTIRADESLEVINAGGYVQQVFGYKDYFFLTAGLRVDGNSAFGSGFGLQAYPKLSASYVLSDMAFWPSDWFESFKLRFAMGDAGKAPGAFDAVRSWSSIVSGDGEGGFTPGALGDPDLGPERSREYEVGFDASLYGGRITAEVTAYRQTTYDALIPRQGAPSLGFLTPQSSNIGTLQNQGGEVTLNVGLLRNRLIDWDVGVTLSLLESEALDTGGEQIPYGFSRFSGTRGWIREGYPVPAVFGMVVTNAAELAAPIIETDGYFGASYPTNSWGFRTNMTVLNNLTFNAFGEWQRGAFSQCQTCQRMVLNQTFSPCFPALHAQQQYRGEDAATNPSSSFWTVPMSEWTGDPSAWNQIPAGIRAMCSARPEDQRPPRYYEKNDFFRLRSVNLSYRLPDGLVPGTNAATLTLSGANLLTFTEYWGNDPEARINSEFPGNDYHSMPAFKTYTASLNITF